MAWKSITLTLLNSEDAEKIEQHLLDLDAVAVTYTDAGDEPILEPALNTTPLWSNTNITALFEKDVFLDVIKTSLNDTFGLGLYKVAEEKTIEDKIWEREWLEHFKPKRFGKRLWVCPNDMQIPLDQQNAQNVIVDMDPGMAFGTGTHETTSLCLQWLDGANLLKKRVLDYGAGSGILAIAAVKLGASDATCLDIDIQAIEACLSNAERNNVLNRIKAYLPDDSDWSQDETFDIILANILATPLIAIVQDIRRRLRRGGQIVLSGILANQADKVSSVYSPYFNMDEAVQDGDWVRLSGRLKTASEMLGEEECVTICPNCDESFFVTAEDLDLADGEVRCGECDNIFFALDFIDPDPDTTAANPDNTFDTDEVTKAHSITGMWMQNKGNLVPVSHTASVTEETSQENADPEPQDVETVFDKPVDNEEIPTAYSFTELWPAIDETSLEEIQKTDTENIPLVEQNTTDASDEETPSEMPAVSDSNAENSTDNNLSPELNNKLDDHQQTAEPVLADSSVDENQIGEDLESLEDLEDLDDEFLLEDTDVDEMQATQEAEHEAELLATARKNKKVDEVLFESISPAVNMYELEDSEPLAQEELAALHAPKINKRSMQWLAASIALVFCLLLQYIHQHRNQLAIHPSYGQTIQSIYAKLPLDIEPDWILDAYSINASSVALNPLDTKQLVASFNLSNTAMHAQIFPIIRLSLFNRWGERIAYKDLNVEDYSPDDYQESSVPLLSARDRIQVKVVIQDPGAEAMDYNVEVCLRKNSIIRCKEKSDKN